MGTTLKGVKESLFEKKFIKSLINESKGEVYFVGGIVRDILLGKENKDIDLVIRNIHIDELINKLYLYGKVDIVGKSFGVIKFKAYEDDTEYDIALPRQETATGQGGHKGFAVNFDEKLSIEKDLIRRDAKINAMAVLINDGSFIDPLGGLDDITNKVISMANPESFSDDPLRMLRVIGFASRFDFQIESKTYSEIKSHANRILEISPERILIEFDKIVKKGNQLNAAIHLYDSGILELLMDKNGGMYIGEKWDVSKSMADFIYLLTFQTIEKPSTWFKNNLKGDVDTYNELLALEYGMKEQPEITIQEARLSIYNMYRINQRSISSLLLSDTLRLASKEMLANQYPLSTKELQLNGDDLILLGFVGKQIGEIIKNAMIAIYFDHLLNEKDKLITFAKTFTF